MEKTNIQVTFSRHCDPLVFTLFQGMYKRFIYEFETYHYKGDLDPKEDFSYNIWVSPFDQFSHIKTEVESIDCFAIEVQPREHCPTYQFFAMSSPIFGSFKELVKSFSDADKAYLCITEEMKNYKKKPELFGVNTLADSFSFVRVYNSYYISGKMVEGEVFKKVL